MADVIVDLVVEGQAEIVNTPFYFTANVKVKDPSTGQTRLPSAGEVTVEFWFIRWGIIPNEKLNTVDCPEGGVTYMGGWVVDTDYYDFFFRGIHKASGKSTDVGVRCFRNGTWTYR